MSRFPFACIPFTIQAPAALALSASIALALWALWPQPKTASLPIAAAIGISCIILVAFPLDASDKIVMLDVGQGDSILVQSRGESLLIDTGNQDAKLQRELALNHVTRLDSVLITHADDDHCGSLDQIRKSVRVERVLVAHDMLTCPGSSATSLMEEAGDTAGDIVGLSVGDSFSVGAFTFRIVWPHRFEEEGGNADSLCAVAEYDGNDDDEIDFTALMTGDAEKEELQTMIDESLVADIDVLKVGHHGSRNGMTAEETELLHPEIALISCGANNRYGHPTREILDMLDDIGAATFRTDLDGEVICSFTESNISIRCSNR